MESRRSRKLALSSSAKRRSWLVRWQRAVSAQWDDVSGGERRPRSMQSVVLQTATGRRSVEDGCGLGGKEATTTQRTGFRPRVCFEHCIVTQGRRKARHLRVLRYFGFGIGVGVGVVWCSTLKFAPPECRKRTHSTTASTTRHTHLRQAKFVKFGLCVST